MVSRRRVRRTAGWIARYVSDDLLHWGGRADGRSRQGRLWTSEQLLRMALLGLASGCKGSSEVEELSEDLAKSARKQLDIPRRLPDTTLRDFLIKLDPLELHRMLSVVGYDAWRRKALRQRDDIAIPFGVVSADGKYPSISDTGAYEYLQVHHQDGEATHGLVRTTTCCLVTALGQPILGAMPIPGSTNEAGGFAKAFGEMVRIYGRLFRLFMYDAGGASKTNANAVKAAGKEYLFLIADPRWQMYKTIELLLRDRAPTFVDEQQVSDGKRWVRKLTLLPVEPRDDGLLWGHTRTLFRIDNEVYENNALVSTHTRFSVTSLRADELTPEQWLELHVIRWGTETAHGILDTAFEEDERPWIRKDAQGTLAVQILRRVAFTLMTLYKNVTLRNEQHSQAPWRKHFEWVKDALKWATAEDLQGLRPRTYAVPPALA